MTPPDVVTRARYEREKAARIEAERLLEVKSTELYAAERARSQFLAVVSHELRTPINGILGSAQALSNLDVDADAAAQIAAIYSCGNSLSNLVNMILDLVRLDARTVKLGAGRVSLRELVDGVVAQEVGRDTTGLTVTYEGDAATAAVMADGRRLGHCFAAVVGNAVKFTKGGRIDLMVRYDASGRLLFRVDDAGDGVRPEDRTRIFDRFTQAASFDDRGRTGAGLGLSFAKDIVALMGGRITVGDSALGGARFEIEMTLASADAETISVAGAGSAITDAARTAPHVLIVDDNAVNRMVAKAAVTSARMTCALAENGREALQRLESERFDVVLMDIQMPIMSGDEAIRRIRGSEQSWHDVPIIVVTAHGLDEGPDVYRSIGANDAMEKPFAFDRLVRSIHTLVA